MELGDGSTRYCVLDEAGDVIPGTQRTAREVSNCAFTGRYPALKKGSEAREHSRRKPILREPQTVPGLRRSLLVKAPPQRNRREPKLRGLSTLVAASKTWLKNLSPPSGHEFAAIFASMLHLGSAGDLRRISPGQDPIFEVIAK